MKINEKGIDEVINTTLSKVKNLIDSNTVIGKSIKINDNNYIIPVNKLSFGVISGGFEKPKKNKQNVSACSTTGVSIQPIGFIAISDNSIDFLSVSTNSNTADFIINKLCKYVDSVIKSKGDYDEK